MCFNNSQPTPPVPAPTPLPPVATPSAPAAPPAPPQLLQSKKAGMGVKMKRSRAEASGAVSRGTSQLRIPVNIGTQKAGGINV